MIAPVAAVSLVWLICLVVFEIARPKTAYPFDFLSMANLLFALNFALPPVGFAISAGYAEQVGRFLHYDGFEPFSANGLTAISIAIGAHALIAAVYSLLHRRLLAASVLDGMFSRATGRLRDRQYAWVTAGLGGLGLVALATYIVSLGGIREMIRLAQPLSAGEVTATYGFLKIIGMLLVPAFYVSFARACERHVGHGWVWGTVSAVLGLTALGLLVHDLGRLQIAIFLFIPVVALAIIRRRGFFLWLPALGVVGWGVLTVFRPVYYYLTRGEDRYLAQTVHAVSEPFNNLGAALSSVLSEFSFPFYVLDRYLFVVPDHLGYRGGEDFIAALILLLPSVLVGGDPAYILDLNRSLFQEPLPIDLLSLGYVSFGLLGIVLFSVLYGAILALCEAVFGGSSGWLSALFRCAWMFYMPWWLMYADPVNAVKRGFGLIVATVLLLVVSTDPLRRIYGRGRGAGAVGANNIETP